MIHHFCFFLLVTLLAFSSVLAQTQGVVSSKRIVNTIEPAVIDPSAKARADEERRLKLLSRAKKEAGKIFDQVIAEDPRWKLKLKNGMMWKKKSENPLVLERYIRDGMVIARIYHQTEASVRDVYIALEFEKPPSSVMYSFCHMMPVDEMVEYVNRAEEPNSNTIVDDM